MTRSPLPAVAASVAAVGLALLLGACGSNRHAAGIAQTTTQATTAAATTAHGGVNPNAPETNPAGDIPDNQVFVDYSPPSGGFTVKVPEGWARGGKGSAVTFTDKLNSVTMQSAAAPSAPTAASAASGELPAIRAAAHNFEPGTVTTVRRRAGPALLLTYRADSAADPVTGKVVRDAVERYEFWNPATRTEAVLTLAGPVGADNVDPWRTVTDSFRWRR
jgi:hypothetical protein